MGHSSQGPLGWLCNCFFLMRCTLPVCVISGPLCVLPRDRRICTAGSYLLAMVLFYVYFKLKLCISLCPFQIWLHLRIQLLTANCSLKFLNENFYKQTICKFQVTFVVVFCHNCSILLLVTFVDLSQCLNQKLSFIIGMYAQEKTTVCFSTQLLGIPWDV